MSIVTWKKYDYLIQSKKEPEAAQLLQQQASNISNIDKTVFIERGRILYEFKKRELFLHKDLRVCANSFDEWVSAVWPYSARDAYMAMSLYEKLRGVEEKPEIAWEDMLEIPRVNLETLKKNVSEETRKKPDVIKAAREMPNELFCEYVNKHYEMLAEPEEGMVCRGPRSQMKKIKKRIATRKEKDGGTTGDVLEGWAANDEQTAETSPAAPNGHVKPNGHANGHAKTDLIYLTFELTPEENEAVLRGYEQARKDYPDIVSLKNVFVDYMRSFSEKWTGPEDTQANEAMVN